MQNSSAFHPFPYVSRFFFVAHYEPLMLVFLFQNPALPWSIVTFFHNFLYHSNFECDLPLIDASNPEQLIFIGLTVGLTNVVPFDGVSMMPCLVCFLFFIEAINLNYGRRASWETNSTGEIFALSLIMNAANGLLILNRLLKLLDSSSLTYAFAH